MTEPALRPGPEPPSNGGPRSDAAGRLTAALRQVGSSAPAPSLRLGPRPGEVIDRSAPLSFTWNGRPYDGFAGDTIVSALAASGERVFSRSLKYHRARG
ncbi:MAG TPA: 2Fe-2S iron-sulfur cluster-binding protein, partial [Acidimicrobiia bacterium]|nr:2Fe-2S iron-sulfur cluster-binding protein [Acidimicrobiia bacterium]